LNIHPSLLPKYRGAAPIPWQIINGEKETGVTIAEVTDELDAGDIFCQLRIPLDRDETTGALTHVLSELSVKALAEVLSKVEKSALRRTPQDSGRASYARKLSKEVGRLDLGEPAELLVRKIRAFDPWPGAFIGCRGKGLRIVEAICDSTEGMEAKPFELLEINPTGFLRIQTGKGSLRVTKVQLAGRQVISGREFANGQRLKVGFRFEDLQ
jgi:methionyl-tRNA formyltransferase